MKVFEDQILDDLAHSGDFDESLNLIPGKYDDAVTNYNPKLTEIFNRCDDQTVKEVQSVLLSLKNNVFGFEVDSGKDDMVFLPTAQSAAITSGNYSSFHDGLVTNITDPTYDYTLIYVVAILGENILIFVASFFGGLFYFDRHDLK